MERNRRLLDADALIEYGSNHYMDEVFPDWIDLPPSAQGAVCRYGEKIKELIDGAPTVDAEPVRHGRWIDCTVWHGRFGEIRTKCSACGTVYPYDPKSRGDGKGGKFCEECGAKMDLEEPNE